MFEADDRSAIPDAFGSIFSAPGLNDIEVELADHGQGLALRLRRAGPAKAVPEPEPPEQRIVQALADAETPLSQRQIRERAATRATTVAETLQTLIRERRVERAPGGGYRLAGAGKERTVTAVDGKNPRDPFPECVSGSNPLGACAVGKLATICSSIRSFVTTTYGV